MIDDKQLVFTPEQVAAILKLSKGTVYQLIKRGEILAKRLGNTFRIPRRSIAFAFEGLDADISDAEKEDLKALPVIQSTLKAVRHAKKR